MSIQRICSPVISHVTTGRVSSQRLSTCIMQASTVCARLRRCYKAPVDRGDVIGNVGSGTKESERRNNTQISVFDLIGTARLDHGDTDARGFC